MASGDKTSKQQKQKQTMPCCLAVVAALVLLAEHGLASRAFRENSSSSSSNNNNNNSLVDVFVAGEEGYYCIKIPDLVVTKNGSLLAFGEARVGSCSDYTETHLVMKRSTDSGRTWSKLQVVHSEPNSVIGNAAPVVLHTSGRILLPHCRDNLKVFTMHS